MFHAQRIDACSRAHALSHRGRRREAARRVKHGRDLLSRDRGRAAGAGDAKRALQARFNASAGLDCGGPVEQRPAPVQKPVSVTPRVQQRSTQRHTSLLARSGSLAARVRHAVQRRRRRRLEPEPHGSEGLRRHSGGALGISGLELGAHACQLGSRRWCASRQIAERQRVDGSAPVHESHARHVEAVRKTREGAQRQCGPRAGKLGGRDQALHNAHKSSTWQ
mmetsp:Transcript_71365/g.172719  ORF Transcript_71365/g.172719 Transcript_71365/m.172719 type:complete len:222 (-) Transcript_71365:2-667(-)